MFFGMKLDHITEGFCIFDSEIIVREIYRDEIGTIGMCTCIDGMEMMNLATFTANSDFARLG
ncbi:hypothetical protein [Methanocalculus sp. MSAO_Arc2]|uniref:hypothetical protein n=1 Tax=Methanocalculus sp. MSAO_Arc2 TaxID=2293855 RepID=UPI0026971A3C